MTQDTEAERFAEWFRQNYPGPDTIIGRPDWHAPKIYRAATHELRKELDEARAERDALRDALERIEDASRHYATCTYLEAATLAYAHESTARLARAALTGEAKP